MSKLVDIKRITKIKNKLHHKTKLVGCRIDVRYIKKLEENDITFADFVKEAFKETFGDFGTK